MNLRELFKPVNNTLEGGGAVKEKTAEYECPTCKSMIDKQETRANMNICPVCNNYFHIGARKRILMYADAGSFTEFDAQLSSSNLLDFPGYEEKLLFAAAKSGERDAVICGRMTICDMPVCVFSMDPKFMMGSMGTVCGEKITRLFEYATSEELPVLGIAVSGGARMQEGMLSLMQMAKISGAVKQHSEQGLLYTVLLTNPTTGGVCASFAMQADVILAEPNALIGFAGPRVIAESLKKKLPKGFQRAEMLMSCGFVDEIVPRNEQRQYLTTLLTLHHRKEAVR